MTSNWYRNERRVVLQKNAHDLATTNAELMGMNLTEYTSYAIYLASLEADRLSEIIHKEKVWTRST